MTANEEDQILSFLFGTPDQVDESSRVEASSSGVKEYFSCARMLAEQIEASWLDLAHVAIGVAPAPFQKLLRDGVCMPVTRLPDKVDVDFQAEPAKQFPIWLYQYGNKPS